MFRLGLLIGGFVALFGGVLSFAQETPPPAGGFSRDVSQPLEISADSLRLDQEAGTAIFEGSVRANQGDFRFRADMIEVFYGSSEEGGAGEIQRLIATGNIKIVSGEQSAEAQSAVFDAVDGIIRLKGEVLLSLGQNIIAGDAAIINMNDGTASVEGRVRTVIQPAESSQ